MYATIRVNLFIQVTLSLRSAVVKERGTRPTSGTNYKYQFSDSKHALFPPSARTRFEYLAICASDFTVLERKLLVEAR